MRTVPAITTIYALPLVQRRSHMHCVRTRFSKMGESCRSGRLVIPGFWVCPATYPAVDMDKLIARACYSRDP